MTSREERDQKFRAWLASLDEEMRRDVPDDLAELSDDELDECIACQSFVVELRRHAQAWREARATEVDPESLRRAADAAREELRQKGLL